MVSSCSFTEHPPPHDLARVKVRCRSHARVSEVGPLMVPKLPELLDNFRKRFELNYFPVRSLSIVAVARRHCPATIGRASG